MSLSLTRPSWLTDFGALTLSCVLFVFLSWTASSRPLAPQHILVLLTSGPTVGPFVTEYSLSSSLSMCYPLEPSSNSGTCCASFFLRQAKPLPMPNYGR
ncbi:hypothetical protein L210DRAFT_3561183, partial [Boletus edulis BED1]